MEKIIISSDLFARKVAGKWTGMGKTYHAPMGNGRKTKRKNKFDRNSTLIAGLGFLWDLFFNHRRKLWEE